MELHEERIEVLEMIKKTIHMSAAISTTLAVEKVARIAEECDVKVTLVDTRMGSGRKWFNDFEVEGASGKVDAFIARIKDIEVR